MRRNKAVAACGPLSPGARQRVVPSYPSAKSGRHGEGKAALRGRIGGMDGKRKSTLASALIASAVLLCVVIVLYVLSFGPVVYLASTGRIHYTPKDAREGFYGPLYWACDHSASFSGAMAWYSELWIAASQPN